MTRVSVAMAVYNGGKYLNEQMGSIINQLTSDDELIVSDNMSTDDSREIILSYFKLYPNIKVVECSEQGIVANFENVINNCKGDYIFLADQDDVWKENKIEAVLKEFDKTGADLILHDCEYVDENLVPLNTTLFKDRKALPGFNRNLWKNAYQGCCMAFKKEMVPMICPIPRDVAMHDQWIGLIAEKAFKVDFMNESLILYRKHSGSNSSNRVGISKKLHYIKKMKKEIKSRVPEEEE